MMDNDFYKLFHEFKSHLDSGMSKEIQAFFHEREEISRCNIALDQEEKVIIDIKLNTFSKKLCQNLFFSFLAFIGYKGINLFICEEKHAEMKYLFLTQMIEGNGVKMDITIS